MSQEAVVLELNSVEVLYEGIVRALSGVSLRVQTGEIVALLGANGAGKTTTLKAASGLLTPERGAIISGEVRLEGTDIRALSARELVRRGVVQVLEGRHCFPHLDVTENLVSGTFGLGRLFGWGRRGDTAASIDRVFERFPRLKERRRSPAGLLSGGEQQMLAIGRALMAEPKVLLLDEPSMGLAPKIVEELFDIVASLNAQEGVTVLLAEQNARIALRYAHSAFVLENGRVVAEGSAREFRERSDIQQFYLGLNHRARRSSGPATPPIDHSSGAQLG